VCEYVKLLKCSSEVGSLLDAVAEAAAFEMIVENFMDKRVRLRKVYDHV